MEFAVVNNYMGPVATKVMKGYSEEDIRGGDDFKVYDIYTDTYRSYRLERMNNTFKIIIWIDYSFSRSHKSMNNGQLFQNVYLPT